MNYHDIYECDVNNGKGVRVTLFVSGCDHGCRGCYNVETWKPTSGKPFTKKEEDHIIELLNDPLLKRKGLSLQGGDPLHEANRDAILRLILRVREECPGKDIWMWTGYTKDEIWLSKDARMRYITKGVDVLIDGKFEQDKHDPTLKWRGSSNQIIHNFSSVEI